MLTCRPDFDPEDIDNGAQSSDDDDSGDDGEVNTGREHYENVGYVNMLSLVY
jgi:protein AATF/BFR2